MKHGTSHNPLKEHIFSDLTMDRNEWDMFVTSLKKSAFLPFIRPGNNTVPDWQEMSHDDKDGLWNAFAALHGKTFNYPHLIPQSTEATEENTTPGFWCSISTDNLALRKEDLEFDGAINIPDIGAVGSFQILVHAMAQNFLASRLYQSYQNGDQDFKYAAQTRDMVSFHVSAPDLAGLDEHNERRMAYYPMPDEFEKWLALPSQQYAMQAAAFISSEIFGHTDIDPVFIELLRKDFMRDQHDMLMYRIDDDNDICDNPSNAYLEKWERRAKAYVTETFHHPDILDIERGMSVARVMNINGFAYDLPDIAKQKTEENLFLRIMAASKPEEVFDILCNIPASKRKALTPMERARLIETLGPQNNIDDTIHARCNDAAVIILNDDTIDEHFIAYYTAIFTSIAKEFRQHDELNTMAKQWKAGSYAPENIAFLLRLNEEVSKHMGIKPRPVFTFDSEGKMQGRYQRNAQGFANFGGGYQRLEDEYGLIVPKNFREPLIALNTNAKTGMMSDLTPRAATGVLVHEIGHHVEFELQRQFRERTLDKDDARAAYVAKTAEWNTLGRVADTRLRSEFSPDIYPQIPSEKVAYWFTEAFEAARPFKFHY